MGLGGASVDKMLMFTDWNRSTVNKDRVSFILLYQLYNAYSNEWRYKILKWNGSCYLNPLLTLCQHTLGTSVNPVLYMDQPIACLREIRVWGQLIISIISEQNHLLGMNYIFCLQMFIQYFLQAFKSVLSVKMWKWSWLKWCKYNSSSVL